MSGTTFFLVPKFEVTREMLAASNSESIADLPIKVEGAIGYCILEVPLENVRDVFDGYSQYTGKGVQTAAPVSPVNRLLLFTPFSGAARAGEDTVFSHVFAETLILKRVVFRSLSASFGDRINMATYLGGAEVSSLVKDFYVDDSGFDLPMPIRLFIPAGVETRLTYKNVGASPTNIFMNFICQRP